MKFDDQWSYLARLSNEMHLRAQREVTGIERDALERIPSIADGPSPESTAIILKAFGLEPSEFQWDSQQRIEWDPSKFDIHGGRVPSRSQGHDPFVREMVRLGQVDLEYIYGVDFGVPYPKPTAHVWELYEREI